MVSEARPKVTDEVIRESGLGWPRIGDVPRETTPGRYVGLGWPATVVPQVAQ